MRIQSNVLNQLPFLTFYTCCSKYKIIGGEETVRSQSALWGNCKASKTLSGRVCLWATLLSVDVIVILPKLI